MHPEYSGVLSEIVRSVSVRRDLSPRLLTIRPKLGAAAWKMAGKALHPFLATRYPLSNPTKDLGARRSIATEQVASWFYGSQWTPQWTLGYVLRHAKLEEDYRPTFSHTENFC